MGGLFSDFPQASDSPQSAMHTDIQYLRDTDPAPPFEWQLPIGQLLTPSTSQLHPLQRMDGLPYFPQTSDRPQSAMHTDIQYSRDNYPTPTAVLDVVRSAVDTITRQNEVISNAKDELCRSEVACKLLEKTIQELEKEKEEMKKERYEMKEEINNLRGEMEKMRQDMKINVGELTRQRHQLEKLKSGVGRISEELSNFELSEIQENDKKIQGGRFSLIRKVSRIVKC
jgi:septation ring formation regulator EzrA